jgi:DNA polymerase-3 subunit delta'
VTLRLGGKVRYYPRFEKNLAGIARAAPILSLLKFARRLTELRAISHHPVNPRLFAERLALDYADAVRAAR